MDCSGLLHILERELHEHKGLALENHLYGCLSLWEQWAEGELSLIDGKGCWEEETFDIASDTDWSQIGETFGFEETSPPYTGSAPYREAWLQVFRSEAWKDTAKVDAVEEPLFARLEELKAVWMAAALPAGELPAGFVPPAADTAEADASVNVEGDRHPKGKARRGGAAAYKKTRRTHGRRSLTPVHYHHTLQMTRRSKHVISV
jgi:hypothetical protein